MSTTELTRHAITRLAQRGFHNDDVDLIRMIGTEVEGGFIVLNRDCQAAERELKHLLERLRRLSGTRLVTTAGHVITAYRVQKATERRLVRSVEDRELPKSISRVGETVVSKSRRKMH
jgi:hypothetical protein